MRNDPKAPMSDLDEFLSAHKQARACKVCANGKAAATVGELLDRKQANDPAVAGVTLSTLHSGVLRPKHGLVVSRGTLGNHVRMCLGRDLKTGRPLGA